MLDEFRRLGRRIAGHGDEVVRDVRADQVDQAVDMPVRAGGRDRLGERRPDIAHAHDLFSVIRRRAVIVSLGIWRDAARRI